MDGAQWLPPYQAYPNQPSSSRFPQQAAQNHRQDDLSFDNEQAAVFSEDTAQGTGNSASLSQFQEIYDTLNDRCFDHNGPWNPVGAIHGARPYSNQSDWRHNSCPSRNNPYSASSNGDLQRPGLAHHDSTSTYDSAYNSFYATSQFQVPEGQSFLHPNAALLNRSEPAESVQSDPFADRAAAPRLRRKRVSGQKPFVPPCQLCGKALKNPSDASKHRLQHYKPYICEEHGCSRRDGFATPNDLERHRKAVHHKVPKVGSQIGYICAACPKPPADAPPKIWPRRDNFKAHVKRRHAGCNEVSLIKASESTCTEHAVDAGTESGYGTASQVDQHDSQPRHSLSSPLLPPSQAGHPAHQGEFFFEHGSLDDAIAGIGGQLADPSLVRSEPDRRFHGPGARDEHELQVPSSSAPDVPFLALRNDSGVSQDTADIPDTAHRMLLDTMSQSGGSAMDWLQDSTPLDAGVAQEPDFGMQIPRHPDGDYVCEEPGCGKRKKRECDLRKHRKRHSRPYGCTFSNCWKSFGSRNDWKRHENSQHFLSEQWRCEVVVIGGGKCGRLIHHEAIMRSHLVQEHSQILQTEAARRGILLTRLAAMKTDEMHLGREGHHRFWCGFCNRLVAQGKGKHSPWEDRFKHIGDHYDKKSANIDDWVCIQDNKRKGDISKSDRKKARQQMSGDSEHSDSDLGESGIPEPDARAPTGPLTSVSLFAAPSCGTGMTGTSAQRSLGKRRRVEDDEDAENVSDDGWHCNGGFDWAGQ